MMMAVDDNRMLKTSNEITTATFFIDFRSLGMCAVFIAYIILVF